MVVIDLGKRFVTKSTHVSIFFSAESSDVTVIPSKAWPEGGDLKLFTWNEKTVEAGISAPNRFVTVILLFVKSPTHVIVAKTFWILR